MPKLTSLTVAMVLLLSLETPAQLSGTYSINPTWPASATNFTSLASAVAALSPSGVSGPVTFDIYDDGGPFTESQTLVSAIGIYTPSTAGLAFAQWVGVSATNRVTFRAAPGESPVIDATGRGLGVHWNGADYVTLEGIEVKGASCDAISLYSDATSGQAIDPIISRCRIHDCGAAGVSVYGNTPNPLNTLIKNCFFWNLQLTNAGGFGTLGCFGYISSRRSLGTRIVNNTFHVGTAAGSQFAVIGCIASGSTEIPFAEVSNNVIVKTGTPGMPVFRYNAPSGSTALYPTVQDANCVYDTSGGSFALYGTTASLIAPNLAAWQTASSRDLYSLNANPLLTNGAGGDHHLLAGSPCIAASVIPSGVNVDIDGQPRSGTLDIGADQYSAATIATVGSGCPGTNNLTPVLYTQQWPFIGNQNFSLSTRLAPPNQAVFLYLSFGLEPAPFPIGGGCNIYLDLISLQNLIAISFDPVGPVFTNALGNASLIVSIPNDPSLVNYPPVGLQELVIDGGAYLGFTLTNALVAQLNY